MGIKTVKVPLKELARSGYEIYQIIAVQEVKPARIPYEVVVIARKSVEVPEAVPGVAFRMDYSPDH